MELPWATLLLTIREKRTLLKELSTELNQVSLKDAARIVAHVETISENKTGTMLKRVETIEALDKAKVRVKVRWADQAKVRVKVKARWADQVVVAAKVDKAVVRAAWADQAKANKVQAEWVDQAKVNKVQAEWVDQAKANKAKVEWAVTVDLVAAVKAKAAWADPVAVTVVLVVVVAKAKADLAVATVDPVAAAKVATTAVTKLF